MIGKMKAIWRDLVGDESYLGGPGKRGVEDKLQPGQACLSNDSEENKKIGHYNNFVALINLSIKRIL